MNEAPDALKQYLSEIASCAPLPRRRTRDLLAEARHGDEQAKREVIQAHLQEVAAIAMRCREPAWASPIEKIQEANLVLIRAIEDPSIEDLMATLRGRIPEVLAEIARRSPRRPPLPEHVRDNPEALGLLGLSDEEWDGPQPDDQEPDDPNHGKPDR